MASSGPGKDGEVGMADVLEALKSIQENQSRLATEVESVSYRLDALAPSLRAPSPDISRASPSPLAGIPTSPVQATPASSESDVNKAQSVTKEAEKSGFTSRIILT